MARRTNFRTGNNEYFRTTATVGRCEDGTPIRKQFYGESKKAAELKRDEYLAALRQGLSLDYQKNTFGKAFEHWLEHVHRHSVGVSTYEQYKRFWRLYVADSPLAGMRLIDIKAANIQGFYNGLMKTTTAKNIYEINRRLKVFFKYCIKSDILVKNPLLAVVLPQLPKTPSETNTALSDADINKLLAACKADIKYFPYVFACFTGLRAGELLALTLRDIDLNAGFVSVNKSVKHITVDGIYKPLLTEAKTPASIRRVPILEEIKPLLQAHINRLTNNGKVIFLNGEQLLFPASTGEYREQKNLLNTYKTLCDRLGIEKGRTIHSLRHTFCTILARQGVSLLEASRLMGHTNIDVTAKIYSHVTDADKQAAVKSLSVYFA